MKLSHHRTVIKSIVATCTLVLCAAGLNAHAGTSGSWVAGPTMPANATIGGSHASGPSIYVCRADMGDGVHPGKVWNNRCHVGWGGTERVMPNFEVLALGTSVSWVSASGGIPAQAVIGGVHASGPNIPICRADMGDGLHPGRVWSNHCHVGWGGTERVMANFEVLVPVVLVGVSPVQGQLVLQPRPTTAPAPLTVVSYVSPPSQPPSGPTCGGIVNGVAQPRCEPTRAQFISEARGECPSGTFFDLTTWACWSCPSGFVRSAAPVISEQACSQASGQALQRIQADFVGSRCPAGSFYDPIRGGECWSCPAGFNRSIAHIEAGNACWVPMGERFSSATRHRNTIWPHDCSSSQFHDIWDGGACWSCPSGFRRTAYHVNNSNACAATVPEQQARAKFEKTAACEPGTIFDPRNGGECWQCPEGSLRTIFPVHEGAACERPAGVTYASAIKSAPLTCEPGDHFDPIDGGSCYRCPAGYDRSTTHVKSGDACKTNTMQWRTTPYNEPGLFQLDGAAEVLRAITEGNAPLIRASLDTVARRLSEQSGTPIAQVRAEQKQIFIDQPQASLVAQAAVYTRLMAAIADPTRSSAIEKRLVESFRKHVIAKRTYIAQDMLNAYYAWKESDEYWRSQSPRSRLVTAMDYGTVPPSFDKLGMVATTGIGVTATGASVVIEASLEALQFAKAAQRLPILGDLLGVALSASTAGWTPATSGETIALFAVRSAGEIALGQAVGQLLTYAAQIPAWTIVSSGVATSVPVAALSTTGPQIIVAGGLILMSIAIDQAIQIAEAEPKLKHAVLSAGTDPELTRMSKTKEGVMQLQTYWSYAVGPEYAPAHAFLQSWGPLARTTMAAM